MKPSEVRKTYKSKKDLALNPREMISDDKNSVFDAFYINNIKQTKRGEIFTLNRYGTAAKKVRKKRHVRKVVKEQVDSGEANIYSTNLTPDKSIRVNRAPDLFDLLLNSSSPKNLVYVKPINNAFDNLQIRNKIKRRSLKKNKKTTNTYNCSSSESSDDENTNLNDMTDILKHNFVVEKETKPYEDSIFKISNETSLLKKIVARQNIGEGSHFKSPNESLRVTECNITTTSPLSSTPFQAKYRGKSIYKFSPIPMNKLDDTEECIQENKTEHSDMKIRRNNVDNKLPGSPILPCPQSYLRRMQDSRNGTKCSEHYVSCQIDDVSEDECNKDSTNSISNSNDNTPFLSSLSYLKNKGNNVSKKIQSVLVPNMDGSSPILKSSSHNRNPSSKCSINTILSESPNAIQLSKEYEPFTGFTDSEIAKVDEIYVINGSSDESHGEHSSNTIMMNKSDENNISTNKIQAINVSEDEVNSYEDIHSNESDDSHTSYDTCESDTDSSDIIGRNFILRDPAVAVDKLSDSVLRYYLNKLLHNNFDTSQSSNISMTQKYSKSHTESETEGVEQEYLTNETSSNSSSDTYSRNDLSGSEIELTENYDSADDYVSVTQEKKKGGISFVTKRRRADYSNDSEIIALDSSNVSSVVSSECNDQTVITADEIKVNNEVGKSAVQLKTCQKQQECNQNYLGNSPCNVCDNSRISVRKSSTATRSNIISEECINVTNEIKPVIVLQPGKKWERSLSIYRRMTIMNESNASILEEDEVSTKKGRKYRESVINTMEMQEKGPLHDESIRNRRQTIISKSFRNTIRIVKETNDSRISLNDTTIYDKLTGFLNEDCDDTVVALSKLSITDVEHEATVIENFHDTSQRERVSSARDYVLRRCNQPEVLLFDECYPDTVLKNCHKIGEGVYGEVFLWRARDGRARVMKIIPVAGTIKVNGESQKDFQEIISEIVIAMELSALRASISQVENHFEDGNEAETLDLHTIENATDIFNEVLAVRCVYGNYPSRLLDLWDLYDESKGSENDNPAILPPDQQYIVLELANAGQDLESYQFNNAEQAYALFQQVAYGLAVAEESYQFEHRDLHWGNVLIAPTEQKYATFVLRGRCYRVLRRGVAGTIIDYSLSRLSLSLGANERVALYNELSTDEELFNAVGDYQFEVYRLMRDKLNNEWKTFEPYTNILWLHYTVDKMITALRYKRTNTKLHKHYLTKLKGIKNRILDYGSTVQFVLTDNEF